MKSRVVRGKGHLLGLRRAASAEHHRRHTLSPHGDRADVGRQHECLAPAEVRRGSPACAGSFSGSHSRACAMAFTEPHGTHACKGAWLRCCRRGRRSGCDGSCEGAAKGVWRTRPREQGTRDGTASRTRSESKIGEVAPRVYPTRRITRVRLGRETSGRPFHVASPMMRPMPNDVFICAVLGHPDMGTRPEVLPGGVVSRYFCRRRAVLG